ncbi:MAG TPA: hemolysin family protein [Polyangiaceae bacterium]|jgi:putative hemolysin
MLLELVIIVLLILINAVFAGAEIAIVSVRPMRMKELADNGHKGAAAVLELKNDPDRFLATIQTGITFVSVTAAVFGGAEIAGTLSPILTRAGWPANVAADVAIAVVIGAVSYLSVVIGELVPKTLALRDPERYALAVGRPLLGARWAARPLVALFTVSSSIVLRLFGRNHPPVIEARHSVEELQQLVGEAAKAGTVDPEVGEIASRALDLRQLSAQDVMIPRHEVVMLARGAKMQDVQAKLLEHTHTRIPVFDGDVDNVVGYVNVKDILLLAWDPKLFVLEDLLRPAYFVLKTMDALGLLQEMRRRHMPFAIVVDEHGVMCGLVTLEDLLEELVGEFFSEHSRAAPELIQHELGGAALVSGTAPVREVNRELGLELPESSSYSTIAGLSLALAGRMPSVGDKIVVPRQAVLEIVEASPRRIRSVRVSPPAD